jgi:hypothetical protein
MKPPPHALRIPLAAALVSILLASGAVAWSMDRTSKMEAQQESTRRSRLLQTAQLAQQDADSSEVSAGLALYENLKTRGGAREKAFDQANQDFPPETDIDVELKKPAQGSESPWIEHTTRVRLAIPHENHLLKMLSRWRARDPGLHHLRACRIERAADALQADCQLARLTLIEGQTQ